MAGYRHDRQRVSTFQELIGRETSPGGMGGQQLPFLKFYFFSFHPLW